LKASKSVARIETAPNSNRSTAAPPFTVLLHSIMQNHGTPSPILQPDADPYSFRYSSTEPYLYVTSPGRYDRHVPTPEELFTYQRQSLYYAPYWAHLFANLLTPREYVARAGNRRTPGTLQGPAEELPHPGYHGFAAERDRTRAGEEQQSELNDHARSQALAPGSPGRVGGSFARQAALDPSTPHTYPLLVAQNAQGRSGDGPSIRRTTIPSVLGRVGENEPSQHRVDASLFCLAPNAEPPFKSHEQMAHAPHLSPLTPRRVIPSAQLPAGSIPLRSTETAQDKTRRDSGTARTPPIPQFGPHREHGLTQSPDTVRPRANSMSRWDFENQSPILSIEVIGPEEFLKRERAAQSRAQSRAHREQRLFEEAQRPRKKVKRSNKGKAPM
jgi:hypothetical protein